jgi:hypothetical protein
MSKEELEQYELEKKRESLKDLMDEIVEVAGITTFRILLVGIRNYKKRLLICRTSTFIDELVHAVILSFLRVDEPINASKVEDFDRKKTMIQRLESFIDKADQDYYKQKTL